MKFKESDWMQKPLEKEALPQPKTTHELSNNIHSASPAIESLTDLSLACKVWPEKITDNKLFIEQITERKEIINSLHEVIKRIPRPDITLEDAIANNNITEEQTSRLYNSLSQLLNSEDYKRIALYLPFEFLPNQNWKPSTEQLQFASDQFKESYILAWKKLLTVHDVRANFVDGDILEIEKRVGDLPRVVKAAHLIPKLIEKGLITFEEIMEIIENSTDEILVNSILDTFSVLKDLNLIKERELDSMKKSQKQIVRNTSILLSLNVELTKNPKLELAFETFTPQSIQEKIDISFSKIDTANYGNVTKKREKWLKQTEKEKIIESIGENIKNILLKNDFSLESFESVATSPEVQQALIEGIRKAIEFKSRTPESQEFYKKFHSTLKNLWKNENQKTNELIAKTFRRLYQGKIITREELDALNIALPKLEGPFSENLSLLEKDLDELKEVIKQIESDPELSNLIYPVALVFGSRLKGYGEKTSDIDIAVFIRPETHFSNREKLQKLLQKKFSHEKIQGEVVEFWLENSDEYTNVVNFNSPDPSLGENSWIHILFGAAWEGDQTAIKELQQKLLIPYFYETDRTIYGQNARTIYLEELESDNLQYRLMHKGYKKFFPEYGGFNTPHDEEIDGNSTFWDSGYRQLATKLFASKVFLPKLPNPEK